MLKKVWIKDFRNIDEIVLDFSQSRAVVLYGENNQGKTNFLEALYFLGNGGSPVTKLPQNMVLFDAKEALVGCDSGDDDSVARLYGKVQGEGERSFFLGDKKVPTYRQLQKFLNIDFVSADIIRVFSESADKRRKALDGFCKRYFSGYSTLLSAYERAVRQKNKTLKEGGSRESIQVWNVSLVNYGAQLVMKRKEALKALEALLVELASTMGMEEFNPITLHYKAFRLGSEFESESDYAAELEQRLKENFYKELQSGYSLYGPHKDDFEVMLKGRLLYDFYSKGINRTFSILLKIAELILMERKTGCFPILLLDDTFAELDLTFKRRLSSMVLQYSQVFYTTILEDDLTLFQDADIYQVKQGTFETYGKN